MDGKIMNSLDYDRKRYIECNNAMPKFQKYYRKSQSSTNMLIHSIYRLIFSWFKTRNHIDLFYGTRIGEGLYIGHPYCISINPEAILGKNVNIHKGVTIGQENRGAREGSPIIGDEVWIGVNATIVGGIKIGNNVLIAPNTFVNCNIPDNSIVFGNPCIIKNDSNATYGYVNNKV